MRVLLIYEAVPEATTMYVFNDLTDEEMAKLIACHNEYQGLAGNEPGSPVESLYEWLAQRQDRIAWSNDKDWEGNKAPLTLEGPITVVHSGFML